MIALRGDVDAANAAAHGERIEREVEGGDEHVVLDATEVGYLDSTGLSLLTRLQRRLNRSGRRLAIAVDEAGAVRRGLEATGLIHMLEVYASVDAATAALAGAPRVGR